MVQTSILKGLAVLAVAVSLIGARQQANPQSMAGKKAPPLHVNGWINTPAKGLDLSSLKGKVVVVDFWAYW